MLDEKAEEDVTGLEEADPAVWEEYKATGDPKLRDQLILHYFPIAETISRRVSSKLPKQVDVGDLLSYATIGLMDAIEKFEPERGVKFRTYSSSRVHGAIIDELRANDWVPRSIRAKAKVIERAVAKLEGELGRTPDADEVAEEAGVSVDHVQSVLKTVSNTNMASLDDALHGDPEAVSLGESLAGGMSQPDMLDPFGPLRQDVAEAVHDLTERERAVLSLHLINGLTMAQVGGILGVTESRVCQIHTKTIAKLRDRVSLSRRFPED